MSGPGDITHVDSIGAATTPKKPRPTLLRLIPPEFHGLIKRASASTGIGVEELAELAIAAVIGGGVGFQAQLLRVAQEAHANRQAQVERELAQIGGGSE